MRLSHKSKIDSRALSSKSSTNLEHLRIKMRHESDILLRRRDKLFRVLKVESLVRNQCRLSYAIAIQVFSTQERLENEKASKIYKRSHDPDERM
jgi:hypothetical protein